MFPQKACIRRREANIDEGKDLPQTFVPAVSVTREWKEVLDQHAAATDVRRVDTRSPPIKNKLGSTSLQPLLS